MIKDTEHFTVAHIVDLAKMYDPVGVSQTFLKKEITTHKGQEFDRLLTDMIDEEKIMISQDSKDIQIKLPTPVYTILNVCAPLCYQTEALCHTWSIDGNVPSEKWAHLPFDQRQWVTEIVKAILFHGTAESGHIAWKFIAQSHGYVFGVVLDPKRKTSPLLQDYDRLAAHQRSEFEMYRSVIDRFLSLQGMTFPVRHQTVLTP